MSTKTRESLGWLGILFLGQLVLVKFWYNHGTIRIPAENTVSYWVLVVMTLWLAFAGLFIMWHMIRNSRTIIPHKIILGAVIANTISSMVISFPGVGKPIDCTKGVVLDFSIWLWFFGTSAIVAYDAICLHDKLKDIDQENLQT